MNDPEFWQHFTEQYGSDTAGRLQAALQQPAEVSIRLNPRKAVLPPEGVAVPWCDTGWWLKERPAFTFDPLFHAGAYYVQEAGSMFLEQALRQYGMEARTALDLCAAPGGKSTLMCSLLPDSCLLVSNEPMPKRVQVLAENMAKWGHPQSIVTQNYPKDFARFEDMFDLIVADVPCSGEGMFRREPEAVAQWCPALVEQCAKLQRSIIDDVWPALRPGGILVYSTCTFNRHEDEDNVEWICRELDATTLPIEHDASWGIIGQHHFIPGCTRSEGFFLAVMRKDGDGNANQGDAAKRLMQKLKVQHWGGQRTVMKGKVEIPAPALALSTEASDYPRAEVDSATALSYLRGESIVIDAPRGFVIITHKGLGLGFVKNLGNRANNLYPDPWRIRSTHGTPVSVI